MIWQHMSLRARLSAILAGFYGFAMICGIMTLLLAAPAHVREEEDSVDELTTQFVRATLAVIQQSAHPEADFRNFLEALRSSSNHEFSFRPAGSSTVESDESHAANTVPGWFANLVTPSRTTMEIPVLIGAKPIGTILFRADMSADMGEKWWAMWVFILLGTGMTICSLVFAYGIIGRSLSPLGRLKGALSDLRSGDYSVRVSCEGPPELANGCRELNELAVTLQKLTEENATLMRRLVTVQDEERRDIARELHDELGPLLFAIRANAVSLRKSAAAGEISVIQMLSAVEALQQTNRRILEKLRPMHFREVGIVRSLQSLVGGWIDNEPSRDISLDIDPAIESADDSVVLTIYRTVQEGLTNAFRHSGASRIRVVVKRQINDGPETGSVVIIVADNGVGMPDDVAFGRGLTGMQERLRALGGNLAISSTNGETVIEGTLPFSRAARLSDARKSA